MILLLSPRQYRRTPWKNGGGTTVDIAVDDATGGDIWRFGRTPITVPGPFSDYAGFDRLQVLIAGRGLVLQTPGGEIDVRTPFKTVRFAGETPIVARLEAGPVEVVNLIGARTEVGVEMQILEANRSLQLGRGTHFAYCPIEAAEVEAGGTRHAVAIDHCLRIEASSPTMLACGSGRLVVASIV